MTRFIKNDKIDDEFLKIISNLNIRLDDIIDKYFINSKLVLRDITDHVKDGKPIKNYLSISLGKNITNYSKILDFNSNNKIIFKCLYYIK